MHGCTVGASFFATGSRNWLTTTSFTSFAAGGHSCTPTIHDPPSHHAARRRPSETISRSAATCPHECQTYSLFSGPFEVDCERGAPQG